MPIDPATIGTIAQGVIATSQAISRGGPRRQYKWNKRAAQDTNQMNRENAIWALEQNRRLQQEQRVYDSPEAQMARYKAAGLNPHLIYGSGSSAGSAFPISAGSIAPSRIDAPMASYPDIAGGFVSAGQALAQTELAQQRSAESEYKQELIQVQTAIAKSNPMLDPEVYQKTVRMLEKTAELKAAQAVHMKSGWHQRSATHSTRNYIAEIDADLNKMWQSLELGGKDLDVKNKILESKTYENALKEIQKKWMDDAEFTPEHIRLGIMMALQKMLSMGN